MRESKTEPPTVSLIRVNLRSFVVSKQPNPPVPRTNREWTACFATVRAKADPIRGFTQKLGILANRDMVRL
jgi:hypothetical protein